jgi:hypothetical protein
MSPFLDRDELRHLTGRARKADQVRWLRARPNIRHWINARGEAVVPRGQFDAPTGAPAEPPRVKPNLAAIRREA